MNDYVLAAYAIGSILLWGYAISLWLEARALQRRRALVRATAGGRP